MRRGPETPQPENATIFEGEARQAEVPIDEMAVEVRKFARVMYHPQPADIDQAVEGAKEKNVEARAALQKMYDEAIKPENQSRVRQYYDMMHKLAEFHGQDVEAALKDFGNLSWDDLTQEYEGAREQVAAKKRHKIDEFLKMENFLTAEKIVQPEKAEPGDQEEADALKLREEKISQLRENLTKLTPDDIDRDYPWAMKEYNSLMKRLRDQVEKERKVKGWE